LARFFALSRVINILDSGRRPIYGGHDETSFFRGGFDDGPLIVHVPKTARDCVIFLGDLSDKGVFRARATGFLVCVPSGDPNNWFPYLVTAEHVVVGIQQRGRPIYCRLNLKNGGASVESLQITRWWHHPNAERDPTDVAVCAVHINWDLFDHACVPLPETYMEAPTERRPRDVGLGDETFTLGLFRLHAGRDRNIPIVRIGNIAAMPEEPVRTNWGSIKAYLVEMRSIAGLSGSPVFTDSPEAPTLGMLYSIHVLADPRFTPPDPEKVNWFRYHFLGLVHGHFDVPDLQEDADIDDDDDAAVSRHINTGIGLVIPAEKVIETLYQADLADERRKLQNEYDKQKATTPDLNVSQNKA
jgi:hypothetical protein